jgi:hypothetical protein
LGLVARELTARNVHVKFVEKFSNKRSRIRSYNSYKAV